MRRPCGIKDFLESIMPLELPENIDGNLWRNREVTKYL
jgi:hypothetical protein